MHNANFAYVVFLLVKAPRSVSEVIKVTGLDEESIRRYFKALQAEGLAKVTPSLFHQGRRQNVWTWEGHNL
jgi:predicted ArsR family transcriptional regulator